VRVSHAATTRFDGGDPAIPSGATGEPTRVVVVGAGMAGLAAASALRNAGVEVVVLEARDRLGGRTWTRDVGGVPIDVGGAWIHTADGNPMSALADCAGVARVPNDIVAQVNKLSGYDSDHAAWLSLADLGVPLLLTQAFQGALPDLRAELGTAASVEEGIQSFIAGRPEAADVLRLADYGIRVIAEQFESARSTDLSLEWYDAVAIAYDGLDAFPVGGYRGIVEYLARGLDVRTGQLVTSIAYDESGVAVTTDTDLFEGSHAIVTVPLGVLKAGAIAFEPALPAEKMASIGALGFGHFEKVALRFDEAFWLDAGHVNWVHLGPGGAREFPVFLDLTTTVGQPALVALCSAAFAESLLAESQDATIDRVRALLAAMFGAGVPAPLDAWATRWGSDPFTRGAYTYVALGASPTDFATLATPVGGRVLFAGEHTTAQRFGYADGALDTGVREAKRLLGASSVALPEPRALPLASTAVVALALAARLRERSATAR
jgi:monoamine oxidase